MDQLRTSSGRRAPAAGAGRRIYDLLRSQIADGTLPSGARVPSTRALAADLDIMWHGQPSSLTCPVVAIIASITRFDFAVSIMAHAGSTFERKLLLDRRELDTFLDEAFPSAARPSIGKVVSVELDHVRMNLEPRPEMIRPGGILSGPTLMALIDGAAYALVIAHVGRIQMAVTHTLNVTFLRACGFETVVADARLMRLGRRLATIDVRLWQGSEDRLAAQSTVGYALP